MRRIVLLALWPLLLGALLLLPRGHGRAQPSPDGVRNGQGTVALEAWPRSLPALLDEMGTDAPYLLPRIDSLALDYRYAVTDTTSRWSFVLSWRPAERVLYEGEVLPRRDAPRAIRMTNVELRADVRVDGAKEAEMIIGVDSLSLRALPDRFAFNVSVAHDRVFLDTSPTEARRLLRRGIVLDRLVVERMGFAAAGTQRSGTSEHRPGAHERRDAPAPSIYAPRTRILVGWRIGPRPYYVGDADGDGDRRTRRPRGTMVGESQTADAGRDREADPEEDRGRGTADEADGSEGSTAEGRAAGTPRSDNEDTDDEEDDTSLQTPALAAAAAVGLFAFAGGTVGLYGRGDTPLGLASGYTHPNGGVQVQAAVNSAVLDDGPDQQLSVRALGFYDLFGARVQPALGLGVMVDPGAGRDVEPAVSGGLVGNLGRIVLYGGIDVTRGTPEVGLSYNFRYGGGKE